MALFVVTGGGGFIGSNLVETILARGDSARVLDNCATGRRSNLDAAPAWAAAGGGSFELMEGDIRDLETCRRALVGADYVLHQAAIPSVPKSIADPARSNKVNVEGTLNVLMAARDAKVKRVVYAASSSAYGDSPTLPKQEDMPVNPLSPYGVAKLTGEYYMKVFYGVYGLPTVSLRYFNIFGPHQDPTSPYSAVLAKFITLMLRGERPTIYGDGEQSRDFNYIDNAVSANLLAATAPENDVAGQMFNIATGHRFNLNETIELLKPLTGYTGDINYAEERSGDIKHSLADISRAQAKLKYQPLVDFKEGLRRTVEWYRASEKDSKQELAASR